LPAWHARTSQSGQRQLLEQFTLVQAAHKVVGVGSVGTRAWIVLMDVATASNPCSCGGSDRPRALVLIHVG
jgi:hypothetical protein